MRIWSINTRRDKVHLRHCILHESQMEKAGTEAAGNPRPVSGPIPVLCIQGTFSKNLDQRVLISIANRTATRQRPSAVFEQSGAEILKNIAERRSVDKLTFDVIFHSVPRKSSAVFPSVLDRVSTPSPKSTHKICILHKGSSKEFAINQRDRRNFATTGLSV